MKKNSIIRTALIFIMAMALVTVSIPVTSFAVFADDEMTIYGTEDIGTPDGGNEGEEGILPGDEGDLGEGESSIPLASYGVNITCHYNGAVTTGAGSAILDKANVEEGGSVTVTATPKRGYSVSDVKVNDVSVGACDSYTVENVTENLQIDVYYEKTGLFVLLDPGHSGYENRSPVVGSYYESVQMWYLTVAVRNELLENYPDVVPSLTRSRLYDDVGVVERGEMAKGYDLFISFHSNADSNAKTDYALAIVSSSPDLYAIAAPVGKALADVVAADIGTHNATQLWTKKQSDGRDWYGVIRGAASVGVPGIILEHSFHTNAATANWLLDMDNINQLAKDEAAVIANARNLEYDTQPTAPKNPKAVATSEVTNRVSWSSGTNQTGYQVYRSTSIDGTYSFVGAVTGNAWTDTNVEENTTYYYKVRSYRKSLSGYIYSDFTAPVESTISFGPTTATATSASTYINIKYTPSSLATAYEIYRSTEENGTYEKIATRSKDCTSYSYADSSALTGVTYYYKVRPVSVTDRGTFYGDFSAPVSGESGYVSKVIELGGNRAAFNSYVYHSNRGLFGNTYKTVPAVAKADLLGSPSRPLNTSIVARSDNTMMVQWNKCTGVDGYIVLRRVGSEVTYTEVARIKNPATQYWIDTSANKKNTNYYYICCGYKTMPDGTIKVSDCSMSVVGQTANSTRKNAYGAYAPKMNITSKTLNVGGTVQLKLTYNSLCFSTWTRWRSMDTKVAKVNSQGLVTAVGKGTCLISARTPDGRDVRCTITVK